MLVLLKEWTGLERTVLYTEGELNLSHVTIVVVRLAFSRKLTIGFDHDRKGDGVGV